MHVLLIEDQEKLAANMSQFLQLEGYPVTVAHDGKLGLEIAMTRAIDLIVLDVNLPSMDGFSVCGELRKHGKNMPILMLTARTLQHEIVHGLNTGADDYLTKPFNMDELLARIRALVRRSTGERSPVLTVEDVVLDTNARSVRKGSHNISLSPKEYSLLEFLLQRRGTALDRPTIIEHVWGGRDELLFSQTVDVHIAYLRRKLGKNIIRTVPGKGYMIPVE